MLALPVVAIYPALVVKALLGADSWRVRLFFVDQVARVFLVLWLALVTLALIYELFGGENRRALPGAKLFFLDREFSRLLWHSKIIVTQRAVSQIRDPYPDPLP